MGHRAQPGIVAAALLALLPAACGTGVPDLPEGPGYETLNAGRPAWTATGSMSAAREQHTATLLADGQVLVAGGQKQGAFDTGNVYFATAEIYSAETGSFTLTGSMASKRVQHVAVPLAGGDVLVAGGSGSMTSATTAELFDPTTGAFTPAGTLTSGRTAAAAAVLADGRVLLTGGDMAGTAEVYDPTTGTFTGVAPLLTARSDHTATLLLDRRVLVTGGTSTPGGGDALASAEIFDPTAGTWTAAAPMEATRSSHTATLLPTGMVLVAGGSGTAAALASAELYDPTGDTWTPAPPMESSRASHTATLLRNGGVLVAGGIDVTSSALRSSELFDPDEGKWIPLSSMNHSRLLHTATPLSFGGVLVAGGEDQSSAELYAPGKGGQACDVGRECESGSCADGVCCDNACTGKCFSCALAGSMGICTEVPPGTDPRLDCGHGAPCDDVCGVGGACESRVGQVCQPAACAANGRIVEATCATAGGACPMQVVGCGEYGCDPGTGACRAACTSVADCAAGYACDTSGQCVQPPNVADPGATGCAIAPTQDRGAAWAVGLFAIAACARRKRRVR
jgi:Galactose oxidase, central domain/Kelch motif